MSDFNKDGNLFGRMTALIVLVSVAVWVGRICGVSVCPIASCGSCPFVSGQK